MKYILILIFLNLVVMAGSVTYKHIPDSIPNAILMNECLMEKGVCNPYFIALNRSKDIKKAKKLGYKIYKKRLILCNNETKCVQDTERLIRNGIKSLDLGAYQMNYFYNPDQNLYVYFRQSDAELKVKKIIANLINTHGYSWETLGRYHSGTPRENKAYYKKLYANINKIEH